MILKVSIVCACFWALGVVINPVFANDSLVYFPTTDSTFSEEFSDTDNNISIEATAPNSTENGSIKIETDTGFSNTSNFTISDYSVPDPSGAATTWVNTVSSNITTDTTWNTDTLVGDNGISIDEGVTLIVEPGVTVFFDSVNYGSLEVNGSLIANGTPSEPIYFTSSAETPAPDDWEAIYIYI